MVSPTTPIIPSRFGRHARISSRTTMRHRYNGGESAVPLPVRKSSRAGLPLVINVILGRFSLTASAVPIAALTRYKIEVTTRPIFAFSFVFGLLVFMLAPSLYIKLVAWDRFATTVPVFSSVRRVGLVFFECCLLL